MRTLPILLSAILLTAVMPPCQAQDTPPEEPKKSKAQERREAKAAEREAKKLAKQNKEQDEAMDDEKYEKKGRGFDFSKEYAALTEGAGMLAEVTDEKSAKDTAKKLISKFNLLAVPMGGSEKELEMWAINANKLNRQMERLKGEPWFVSSGLQEAWTLATDPFSRRKAEKGR